LFTTRGYEQRSITTHGRYPVYVELLKEDPFGNELPEFCFDAPINPLNYLDHIAKIFAINVRWKAESEEAQRSHGTRVKNRTAKEVDMSKPQPTRLHTIQVIHSSPFVGKFD